MTMTAPPAAPGTSPKLPFWVSGDTNAFLVAR